MPERGDGPGNRGNDIDVVLSVGHRGWVSQRAGDRWGRDGPPQEAYGRVSDPERFRGLHAVGRALLDELAGRFRVRRETFLDDGRPDGAEPGELLRPDQPGVASFGLGYTEAPGLQLWWGGVRRGHLPHCACDACDLTVEWCEAQLRDMAEMVAAGSFGERLVIEGNRWWHKSWFASTSGSRGEDSRPVDDAEAERLLERMPGGTLTWAPWATRPAALDPRRAGADAGHTAGVVRSWSNDEAWGVIDSPATPGGCWAHYSMIDMLGFRELRPGQHVHLEWERACQDGYGFRAVRVVPDDADQE